MKLNKQFIHVPVYQPGKSLDDVRKEYGIKEVIKLSSNENPFGTSERVKERIMKDMQHLAVYPDGAGANIKEALAAHYEIQTNQIILGNGSDEIIKFLSRVYLNQHTEVIMATPTFPIYKANAIMENAQIIEVPLSEGVHHLEQMGGAISDKTALIWICNPNNPTGTMITDGELIDFLEKVPKDVLVIVDEAYAEYVSNSDYPNTLKLLKQYPNLMLLRTFSKIYGLASLRIGYGIANENIINDLAKVREPFNVNHLAQIGAEAALKDQQFVRYSKELNAKSKELLLKGLEALGINYYPSETNFVLIRHGLDDELVFKKFLEEGIIIRPGNKLGLPGTARVTIGTMEQIDRIINTFQQLF